MMFHQTENFFDITNICNYTIGVILLISYVLFAYFVTHKGDFYHIRRWKAAIWLASILSVILWAILLFILDAFNIRNLPAKNIFEIGGLIIGTIFSVLTLIIPFLFVVTLGTHHRLKWGLNSDDYLDKIWKDPNKGHKSPIQEI